MPHTFAAENKSKGFQIPEIEEKSGLLKYCCKMGKKHDEGNDVRILTRLGRVKVNEKEMVIRVPKNAVVGNKAWGRIDFLTNHRGWKLVSE